ncbi:MAG: glycosyltransferase family 4 protein [Rhodobacteraceae bacterium]|jgi:mannosyltransferase|uniref:glycosyltransferase family 4 protein n=1 Tax=Albidovulum sp. TaxID=1872424 RepID=UPI001D598749|nr:glycosyltransferase family 4 protein [uncultured Defluviimonas sp.]MCB2125721.1 glycosyltransferase family 4 protein [Paracoccaceae bacterium]MCC0071273.1 glycosyltransferase family 4 protein [Paracoccaceae bacterium]
MSPDGTPDLRAIEVIAPNLKRRLSGVTATVVRLVPLQARTIGIVATGPGLPPHVPHLPLWRMFVMPRNRLRVWHARRNTEMALGLVLRGLFRRRLALLFTSASQRRHTGYTRWLIARMDGLIATSARSARYLERRAEVIHHGIDTEGFSPPVDRAALRRRLGLPEVDVILGCFGRIRAQKGTDAFVDAAIDLLQDRPGMTALVMGRATEGHEAFLGELKARAAAAGLADRIRFMPEVPVHDIADWYRALDLYVAPQRWEGFGLTPLEAMACGVPVVATRVGAFEEIVTEDTGSLVPPGDVPALASAIAALLDDAARRNRAGRAALERVRSRFRLDAEAAALVAVYRRLLAGERW